MAVLALIVLCSALMGLCKALSDLMAHEKWDARMPSNDFWGNINRTWRNKYSRLFGSEGPLYPKFWGSTTIFVWLTDGWHLCNAIAQCALFALLTACFFLPDVWWMPWLVPGASIGIRTAVFHAVYHFDSILAFTIKLLKNGKA